MNDTLKSLDSCRLLIEQDSVAVFEAEVRLPPDSAQIVGMLHHQFELELTLHQGNWAIAHNSYDLEHHEPTPVNW